MRRSFCVFWQTTKGCLLWKRYWMDGWNHWAFQEGFWILTLRKMEQKWKKTAVRQHMLYFGAILQPLHVFIKLTHLRVWRAWDAPKTGVQIWSAFGRSQKREFSESVSFFHLVVSEPKKQAADQHFFLFYSHLKKKKTRIAGFVYHDILLANSYQTQDG